MAKVIPRLAWMLTNKVCPSGLKVEPANSSPNRGTPVLLMSRFQYDNLECIGKVNAPVLIVHSPRDDIIPYAHGQKIYAAAREPKAFLEIAGGHNNGFVFMRPEWVKAVGAFLAKASGAK